MSKKNVMSKEASFNEVKEFVLRHKKKDYEKGLLTDEIIEKDYSELIFYMEQGKIVIENGVLKYTLSEPLYPDAKDESLIKKVVTFKSRVKQYDKTLLMDGIDVSKKQGTFVIKLMSLASGLTKLEIQELCDDDFQLIQQVSSVF